MQGIEASKDECMPSSDLQSSGIRKKGKNLELDRTIISVPVFPIYYIFFVFLYNPPKI